MRNIETNKKEGIDKAGDYAILSVPKKERKGFASIAWVGGGWTTNVAVLFAGGALAMMLPLRGVFTALAVYAVVCGGIGMILAAIGAKYGVSATNLSRQAFGRYGSWFPGGLFALSLGIGWFAWNVALFAHTMHAIYPEAFWTNYYAVCIWGGIFMILTAAYGFRGLGILSFLTIPMIFVVSAFGIAAAIGASGLGLSGLFELEPAEPGTLALGITIVIGAGIAGTCSQPDVSRYAKSPVQGAIAMALGTLCGFLLFASAGALMVMATRTLPIGTTPNLISAMQLLGMGIGALFILLFAQWTSNDNNLYSGSLGITNIVPISKKVACVIMGCIGIGMALAHVEEHFVPFMNMLGLVIPPIAGVIISDFLILRRYTKREYATSPGSILPCVNALALGSSIAAAVISYSWVCVIPGALLSLILGFVFYGGLGVIFEKAGIKYLFGKYTVSETGF